MSLYPFQSKLLNVQTKYFYCLIIYRDRDNRKESIDLVLGSNKTQRSALFYQNDEIKIIDVAAQRREAWKSATVIATYVGSIPLGRMKCLIFSFTYPGNETKHGDEFRHPKIGNGSVFVPFFAWIKKENRIIYIPYYDPELNQQL